VNHCDQRRIKHEQPGKRTQKIMGSQWEEERRQHGGPSVWKLLSINMHTHNPDFKLDVLYQTGNTSKCLTYYYYKIVNI
jgi:hypothetical protein